MMKDYFEGWEDKANVQITGRKQSGLQDGIVVRKPVKPIREKRPEEQEEIYDGDAPTVLLSPEMNPRAYIRRVSTGEEAEVDKDGFVIGKSVEADFVVKSNPTVSRKHVEIRIRPDGYWLKDLGSSNHVFVDGRQITEPVKLTDGMRFTLSLDEEFEFLVRMGKEDGCRKKFI